MPRLPIRARYAFSVSAYIAGGFVLLFAAAVIGKSAFRTLPAQAATSVLSPKFCLGGWSNPKNVSGEATLSAGDPDSSYTAENSAVLDSSVSAQLFCGYFDATDHAYQPSKVRVKFQWAMKSAEVAGTESLSSSSGFLIATSTGFGVIGTSTNQAAPVVPVVPAAPVPTEPIQPIPTPVIPPEETASSTEATSTPPTTPSTVPTPDATSTPVFVPPAEATSTPTSFIWRSLLGLVAETAHAESPDGSSQSANPFLQVSYSTDGVRWTVLGTVGADNLKDYQVDVPINSWSDLASLQIMVSVLPSVDKKPDVYLESISANADYDRTFGEAVSDTVGAAADALDAAVAKVLPKNEPQDSSREVTITRKKVTFAEGNPTTKTPYVQHTDIKARASSDGSSLTISGRCSSKYYVILVFKNPADFITRPTSALVNGAWECENGSFSYDASSLSLDMKTGRYYIVTGEEDDTGPWRLMSPVFPVDVTVTTVSETVTQP